MSPLLTPRQIISTCVAALPAVIVFQAHHDTRTALLTLGIGTGAAFISGLPQTNPTLGAIRTSLRNTLRGRSFERPSQIDELDAAIFDELDSVAEKIAELEAELNAQKELGHHQLGLED